MYVPFRRAWRERDWHCIPAFLTHLMAFGVVVSSSNGRSVSDTNYTQVSYGSIYSRDECINGREYSLPSAFPFRPSSTVLPVMVVPSATKIEHSQFPHCSGVEIHKKKNATASPTATGVCTSTSMPMCVMAKKMRKYKDVDRWMDR